MGIIERVDGKLWQAVSPLIVNDKDGSILVWIPPGEFEMGDESQDCCPKHRVFLDGYYLGVHCISNRQYQRFVEATGHWPPDTSFWQDRAKADHPVVGVSWEDASTYCAWAGLALPTEAQWERGARGPENLLYPWGDDWNQNKCRHNNNRGGSETTCPVFAYPQGASGFGTLNQSGNVSEWCRDWFHREYYFNLVSQYPASAFGPLVQSNNDWPACGFDPLDQCNNANYSSDSPARNPAGPTTGSYRVVRGDGWDAGFAGSFRAADRGSGDPADRFISRGFRLCLPPA